MTFYPASLNDDLNRVRALNDDAELTKSKADYKKYWDLNVDDNGFDGSKNFYIHAQNINGRIFASFIGFTKFKAPSVPAELNLYVLQTAEISYVYKDSAGVIRSGASDIVEGFRIVDGDNLTTSADAHFVKKVEAGAVIGGQFNNRTAGSTVKFTTYQMDMTVGIGRYKDRLIPIGQTFEQFVKEIDPKPLEDDIKWEGETTKYRIKFTIDDTGKWSYTDESTFNTFSGTLNVINN